MSKKTTKRDRQRGSVFVESALVFTVVISMILFVMDMGRLLFYKQYFTERARAGARWASTMGGTWRPDMVKNVVVYNSTTGSGPGPFGLTTANVQVDSTPTNFAMSSTGPESYIRVTISGYQTVSILPWIAGRFTMPPVMVSIPLQCMSGGSC